VPAREVGQRGAIRCAATVDALEDAALVVAQCGVRGPPDLDDGPRRLRSRLVELQVAARGQVDQRRRGRVRSGPTAVDQQVDHRGRMLEHVLGGRSRANLARPQQYRDEPSEQPVAREHDQHDPQ